MKAVSKVAAGPGALELRQCEPRTPEPDEVMLATTSAGICGTDRAIFEWPEWVGQKIGPHFHAPVILGHEGAGTVVAVGADVTSVREGDLVAVEPHAFCGVCSRCVAGEAHICENLEYIGISSDGLFAEFATVAERQLVKLPAIADPALAGMFEPFGLAIRVASFGVGVEGQTVLVTGGGPIGLLTCLVASRLGAAQVMVSEVNPYRLDFARLVSDDYGIDEVVDASDTDVVARARASTVGAGVDVWIDVAGGPGVFDQGLAATRDGGEGRLFAPGRVGLDLNEVVLREISLHGLHGRLIFDTWDQLVELLPSVTNELSQIVTHRLALDDYETAFELVGSGQAMKVLFEPQV